MSSTTSSANRRSNATSSTEKVTFVRFEPRQNSCLVRTSPERQVYLNNEAEAYYLEEMAGKEIELSVNTITRADKTKQTYYNVVVPKLHPDYLKRIFARRDVPGVDAESEREFAGEANH